ncbi:MAG: DUF1003 domain-containing protein [Alphaproteobacteria bacterium]|nr:MAG: DUF1003 domain-containing protein [Alphaproteobacteria bacterium]
MNNAAHKHPITSWTDADHQCLTDLRHIKPARKKTHVAPPTIGQKVADAVAALVGSWGFILLQTALIACWIGLNLFGIINLDPFPFILLNLLLSFQAAYTAPVIMMSQNRQSEIDRRRAENDYAVNLKAELEIEQLHQKIDLLREQEILKLTQIIEQMSAQIAQLAARK